MNKKVIVIGAGVSGMTAARYLLDNNFDVLILEKNNCPGGECVGWARKGVNIDGCAHWIAGLDKNNDLYPLWKHVGAINDDIKIYRPEFFSQYDLDGDIISFYSDLDKLEEELLRVSPEDKKAIKKFIKLIKTYKSVSLPIKKPIDLMNIFELTSYGIKFLPMLRVYTKYKHVSTEDFGKQFKSEKLQKIFKRILVETYNTHSLLYTLNILASKDGGITEGGSMEFSKRIAENVVSHGAKIKYNVSVKRIIIENNIAKGVELDNGEKIYCDYVVSSVDAHYLMYQLLEGKYHDKFFEKEFADPKSYPPVNCILISLVTDKDISHISKNMQIEFEPFKVGDDLIDNFGFRNYSFDRVMNKNKNLIEILIQRPNTLYDYFKSLTKDEYAKAKIEISKHCRKIFCDYVKMDENDFEIIDITTPLTYERYCNAYRGSFQSFISTDQSKALMRPGKIKGIKNLVLTGQWLMNPGGLPIAVFTGKHAAYRVAHLDKKKFKDLDNLEK